MEVDQDAYKLKGSSLGAPTMHDVIQAFFTLRVRANVQPKSSIPIGAKVEISSKGFTLGLKAKIEKICSICPKLLTNAEHYGRELFPWPTNGYH
jgi:hypothetical protein